MSADRITGKDVDRAFAGYVAFCEANGLVPAGMRYGLDHGSRTYGRAFRIFLMPADSYAHHRPNIGDDFLGMTNREAFDALVSRRRLAFDVLMAAGVDVKWGES